MQHIHGQKEPTPAEEYVAQASARIRELESQLVFASAALAAEREAVRVLASQVEYANKLRDKVEQEALDASRIITNSNPIAAEAVRKAGEGPC